MTETKLREMRKKLLGLINNKTRGMKCLDQSSYFILLQKNENLCSVVLFCNTLKFYLSFLQLFLNCISFFYRTFLRKKIE